MLRSYTILLILNGFSKPYDNGSETGFAIAGSGRNWTRGLGSVLRLVVLTLCCWIGLLGSTSVEARYAGVARPGHDPRDRGTVAGCVPFADRSAGAGGRRAAVRADVHRLHRTALLFRPLPGYGPKPPAPLHTADHAGLGERPR